MKTKPQKKTGTEKGMPKAGRIVPQVPTSGKKIVEGSRPSCPCGEKMKRCSVQILTPEGQRYRAIPVLFCPKCSRIGITADNGQGEAWQIANTPVISGRFKRVM